MKGKSILWDVFWMEGKKEGEGQERLVGLKFDLGVASPTTIATLLSESTPALS